ncbi:DUF1190 domain-containing protein [Brevundimonas sp. Leaf363]|uniref:DUF1190 domain-containing protein n=1 Tax=Brevundimonas sp. Leaf363 TaxID=1736353 RepID=UPI0009E682C6|nr:DUF1190 domain-containing protein [Brevundimonas sp. Leaf363]
MSDAQDARKRDDALPAGDTMRRMKRSRALHMTGLMATVGFSMAACEPQGAVQPPEATPQLAYTSLADCKAANDVADTECDAGFATADQNARATGPRYVTRQDCEGQWGPSQCRELSNGSGGSIFGPLVTGFFLGQMLNGGRSFSGAGPLYRDRYDQYSNGYGGYVGRDYRSGRTVVRGRDSAIASTAPTRVQSRTATVSRGGFGGGSRGYGG